MTVAENLPAETIIEILKATTDVEVGAGKLPLSLIRCAQLLGQNINVLKWTSFWLDKSKSLPISIIINIPRRASNTNPFWTFHFLLQDYVVPNIYRLRAFHCDVLIDNYTSGLFSSLIDANANAPILEELVIRCPNTIHVSAPAQHRRQLFSSTPKLRGLTVQRSDIVPPFTNLTSLDVHGLALSDEFLRKLASDSPGLESLALRRIHLPKLTYDKSNSQLTPIPMPSLRDLTMVFFDAFPSDWMDRCKHASSCIVAPSLQSLNVSISPGSSSKQPFGISLSNILPDPAYLKDLRSISLHGVKHKVENHRTHRILDNSVWFRGLPNTDSVEDLSLSNSSGEVLGLDIHPLPNGSLSRTDESQRFMNVKCITLDSALPEDVLWLCRVISARPSIRRVCLYKAREVLVQAGAHLIVTPNGVFDRKELEIGRYGSGEVPSPVVEDWLRERVELLMPEPVVEAEDHDEAQEEIPTKMGGGLLSVKSGKAHVLGWNELRRSPGRRLRREKFKSKS
ncbi:hypothetical protein L218DRAFT_991330 [Marasmius fiardii PR-910]|nr:hypothetical protein L218DRAFT_991330 [Marasmius fiardii PR-910]